MADDNVGMISDEVHLIDNLNKDINIRHDGDAIHKKIKLKHKEEPKIIKVKKIR